MKLALPFFFALLIPNPAFCRTSAEEVGDRFRITLHHTFESEDGEGLTSSSTGTHAYLQQVRAVRPDGVEKVYDLPLGGDDEKRLVNWQFPVRVLEAKDGHLEILNRNELEKRRDRWLAAAEIPADACGSWYFTWTAFQVECDPDAVLETVRAITLRPEGLRDGATVEHAAALEPGKLSKIGGDASASRYRATMQVDPDYIYREEARNDVVVGQIMSKPVRFEDAYAQRKSENITGSIELVLESDADGHAWKRTTSITTVKSKASGAVERAVTIEVLERKREVTGQTASSSIMH